MIELTFLSLKNIGLIALLLIAGIAPIKLSGVKTKYTRQEKLIYQISNNSNQDQFVNIALEASIVYPIKPGKNKSFSYKVKDIDDILFKDKELQTRLKVSYRSITMTGIVKILYSDTILINK